MKSIKLIVIFVGIIAAFVSGLLIGGGRRSGDEDSVPSAGKAAHEVRMVTPVVSDESKVAETPPTPVAPELTATQKSVFKSAAKELSKKDLTFAKVNDLYALYSGLSPELRKLADSEYSDAVAKIKAYHAVVDILQKGDAEKIKTLDADNADMRRLDRYHRDLVLAIYYGDYRGEEPKLYALRNMERGDYPALLGSEGGLNFYIKKRAEERYKSFEDLEYLFSTRNYYGDRWSGR